MADKLMRIVTVMSFFLGMALLSGCGTNRMHLTNADNGKQVAVKSGDVIVVTLESNPTTGFSWQLTEMDNAVLKQVGEVKYESDGRNIPGAGGTETFRFEAVSAGEVALTLWYMRPWESVQPLETFTIQVVVQ